MATDEVAKSTVGILSLGDMGAGIARVLVAQGFPVVTNCEDRSQDTVERARGAKVELVPTDLDLVRRSTVILSVVPPRDAEATARRVADALLRDPGRREPVYFVDLNAVSPSTCRQMAAMFTAAQVPVRFVDGCILGPPPRRLATGSDDGADAAWERPSIPVSGPHDLSTLVADGRRLAAALKLRVVSPRVGDASGLKMCFAAINKGFVAIATQSFATAHRLGVAHELRREMAGLMPAQLAAAERGVPGMPPKAYRWVHEMHEIAATMSHEGPWGRELFDGVAAVYQAVADNEVLGRERIGRRERGGTLEDVAALMAGPGGPEASSERQ
ncbi:hypothetical protein CDD83_6666 [Cordyceps sp. RAO-2017]|nr:hypothetical protein CDD83_6666 [Cordyceps sp. RAO-2017]